MGDFEQVGAANLWKSGPLFSTGTKEAELMRSSSGLICGRLEGQLVGAPWASRQQVMGGRFDRRLSTAFAERQRAPSTGVESLIFGCGPDKK
jgi:hypothetical protein